MWIEQRIRRGEREIYIYIYVYTYRERGRYREREREEKRKERERERERAAERRDKGQGEWRRHVALRRAAREPTRVAWLKDVGSVQHGTAGRGRPRTQRVYDKK